MEKRNGMVEGLAVCLDYQCTIYRFRKFLDAYSGEIQERPDPTGIGAIIQEINQRPWCEVETPDMIEPSVIVNL